MSVGGLHVLDLPTLALYHAAAGARGGPEPLLAVELSRSPPCAASLSFRSSPRSPPPRPARRAPAPPVPLGRRRRRQRQRKRNANAAAADAALPLFLFLSPLPPRFFPQHRLPHQQPSHAALLLLLLFLLLLLLLRRRRRRRRRNRCPPPAGASPLRATATWTWSWASGALHARLRASEAIRPGRHDVLGLVFYGYPAHPAAAVATDLAAATGGGNVPGLKTEYEMHGNSGGGGGGGGGGMARSGSSS